MILLGVSAVQISIQSIAEIVDYMVQKSRRHRDLFRDISSGLLCSRRKPTSRGGEVSSIKIGYVSSDVQEVVSSLISKCWRFPTNNGGNVWFDGARNATCLIHVNIRDRTR